MLIRTTPVTITLAFNGVFLQIAPPEIHGDCSNTFRRDMLGDEEFHFCNGLPGAITIEPKSAFAASPHYVPLSDQFRKQARREAAFPTMHGDIVSLTYRAKVQALEWLIWLEDAKFDDLTGIMRRSLAHKLILDIDAALYNFKGSFNGYEAPTPTEDEFRAGAAYIHLHDLTLRLRQATA